MKPAAPAPAGPWVSARERRRLARDEAKAEALRDMFALRDVPPRLTDPDDDGFRWAPEGWSSSS